MVIMGMLLILEKAYFCMNLVGLPSENRSVIYKTGLSFNNLVYILNSSLFIYGFPLTNPRETAL